MDACQVEVRNEPNGIPDQEKTEKQEQAEKKDQIQQKTHFLRTKDCRPPFSIYSQLSSIPL